ncbi:MAG: CarD family transcriptional regulator [Oscillospiraceae bacterium]|jgi:CarD family transcriptional regulator|nr:CarD family transcriptional regulator [Oscillospiraceae bacterium]
MFSVGDKIVHPMHGAGVVDNIISQKVDGIYRQYYVIKMPLGGMLVMIPINNSDEIGVRPVIDSESAEEIIESMSGIEIDMTQNWNRRYRENMLRIKSGDLMEVAKVVKGLMSRERQRGLSTGERKMLHAAKQILISEIVLAQSVSYEDVERRINTAMA